MGEKYNIEEEYIMSLNAFKNNLNNWVNIINQINYNEITVDDQYKVEIATALIYGMCTYSRQGNIGKVVEITKFFIDNIYSGDKLSLNDMSGTLQLVNKQMNLHSSITNMYGYIGKGNIDNDIYTDNNTELHISKNKTTSPENLTIVYDEKGVATTQTYSRKLGNQYHNLANVRKGSNIETYLNVSDMDLSYIPGLHHFPPAFSYENCNYTLDSRCFPLGLPDIMGLYKNKPLAQKVTYENLTNIFNPELSDISVDEIEHESTIRR